jgi:hypothetical protein
LNWHQKQAELRAAGRRLYDRERAERIAAERQEAEYNRRLAAGEMLADPQPTAEEIAEAAEAEARCLARLPWWDRMSPKDRSERDATIARSRYLSC